MWLLDMFNQMMTLCMGGSCRCHPLFAWLASPAHSLNLPSPAAVMFGMACGAGKQARCFQINLVSCWGLGLPTGLALGFWGGLGVEGLFAGLVVAAAVQCGLYATLLLRLRWEDEAAAARKRALAAQRAAAAVAEDGA